MFLKRSLWILVAVVLLVGLGVQAQSSTEKEITKLENDWSVAWQKKDVGFLKNLWADEYLNTDQDGSTYTKAQDLANVAAAGTSITSFALTDMKVHFYGEVAVVTGLNTIKAAMNGKDVSGAYRFTDVFVRRDGRWKVVSTQGTLVQKKKSTS